MSDGDYMLKAAAVNMYDGIKWDDSNPFTIDNGYAGIRVSDVRINDMTIKSDNWVKDGDNVKITAGITGSYSLDRESITADLSGFNRQVGVIADSFDGFTATWMLSNVACNPSNGMITVTVKVEGIDSNYDTINADNTNPELNIDKPTSGLYFYNFRLIPLSRLIVIGPITVYYDISDNYGFNKLEFLLDGEIIDTVLDNEPNSWYLNQMDRGQHKIEIIAYDFSGNKVSQELDLKKLF
jgi:hypothetical protein